MGRPPAHPAAAPTRRGFADHHLREVVNTLQYLNRAGCQWDMLPHDLVPKGTAYDYFARWRDVGTWQTVLDALRGQGRAGGSPKRRSHRQPDGEDDRAGRRPRVRRGK